MGKKGSWFSAIKRFCTSNSKQKPVNEVAKKSLKEKKHGIGNRSFIPLFREPSSIEKILGEVDQHNLFIAHPHPQPYPTLPHQSEEAQSSASGRPQSPSPPPPPPPHRPVAPQQTEIHYTPQPQPQPQPQAPPSVQQRHLSATRIQAAYRGYTARRKLRGLTGLVRLQGVVRGQHVKRQTVNAMKQMQLLVRLQTQIQSQRMQTIENQALKRRQPHTSAVAKDQLEIGDKDWDDSLITKEEREARLHRKLDALNKRDRAMAYAYSHQLWKATPKSAQNTLMGYPWWWNWLDRELPSNTQLPAKNHQFTQTPQLSRATTQSPQSSRRQKQTVDSPIRPSSSRSMAPSRTRQLSTTPSSRMISFSKPRGASASASASPYPIKDDDSLMSCPPFSVPNYMSPTVSAKAKARPTSNPKDRVPGTPGSVSSQTQRRFSFPATPNSRGSGKLHKSPGSVGDSSVDSAFSIQRKPFNRFV